MFFIVILMGCSAGPVATDQELPTGPVSSLSPDFGSSEYRLPSLLSDRLVNTHVPLIQFFQSPIHSQTKSKMLSKVDTTIEHK